MFGGLVLGCIKTNFCKKICVRQHFSSSTRFAYFCTAAISKFSQKIGLKNQQFLWKFSKKVANVAKFAKYCQISNFQLDNLVDFEKCWKTHIYLQRSVQIQPKTSWILPNFAKNCKKLPKIAIHHRPSTPARSKGARRPAPRAASTSLSKIEDSKIS